MQTWAHTILSLTPYSCVFLNTNAPTSGPRVRTLTLTAVAQLTLLTWSVDWCYFELSAFLTWVWWLSCELDAAVCVTMIEHWPAVGPDLQQEHCSPVQSTKQIITLLGSDWFVYSLKSDLSWLSGWRPALSQPVSSLRPGRRCLAAKPQLHLDLDAIYD